MAQLYEGDIAEDAGSFLGAETGKEVVAEEVFTSKDQEAFYRFKIISTTGFAMGTQKVLGHFKISNKKNVAQFIHGSYEEVSETEILLVMEHFISRWEKVRQQYLLNQVAKAKTQNKLTIGMQEVLKAARKIKGGY